MELKLNISTDTAYASFAPVATRTFGLLVEGDERELRNELANFFEKRKIYETLKGKEWVEKVINQSIGLFYEESESN